MLTRDEAQTMSVPLLPVVYDSSTLQLTIETRRKDDHHSIAYN